MTSSTPAEVHLTVHTVEEALDVIPHLLGFHPAESLVILVVEGGVVAVTARVDLADIRPAGALEQLLGRIWQRFPAAGAWFLAYTADHGLGWHLLGRCATYTVRSGLRRLTLVDGVTWWDGSPDGPSGSHEPGHGAVAAAAAFHGLAARGWRADLEACLAGPPDDEEDLLLGELAVAARSLETIQKGRWPARMVREVRAAMAADAVDDQAAARLALLACHRRSRDAALLLITRFDASHHLSVWQRVVNRVPERCAGNAIALAGLAAWVCGDGALVSICLEKLARMPADPELPAVLGWVTDEVVPPVVWDSMREGLLDATTVAVRRAVCRPASRRGT